MIINVEINDFPNGKIPRTTAQQKRYNAKTGIYFDSPELASARMIYLRKFYEARQKAGIIIPMESPVVLDVFFHFKAKRKKDVGQPKLTRPDLDNMVKLIADCITKAGIIRDDSQIFDLHLVKRYDNNEFVEVKIHVFDN